MAKRGPCDVETVATFDKLPEDVIKIIAQMLYRKMLADTFRLEGATNTCLDFPHVAVQSTALQENWFGAAGFVSFRSSVTSVAKTMLL